MFKRAPQEVVHAEQDPELFAIAMRASAIAHIIDLQVSVRYKEAVRVGVHPRDEIDYADARQRLAEVIDLDA